MLQSIAAASLGLATPPSFDANRPTLFEPLQPRSSARSVLVRNLWQFQMPYKDAHGWQRHLVAQRIEAMKEGADDQSRDAVILLQHPPVFTLGSSSTLDNVRDKQLGGFDLVRTERGGEVTYHGPGQLVLYPVLDLRAYRQDLHWYLRALEEVAIRTLGDFGVPAHREAGLTGVWTPSGKACAIGVKVSKWVSMHGLSLNVAPEMSHYEHIVPCGIDDKPVTSLMDELRASGQPAKERFYLLEEASTRLLHHFGEVFEVELDDTEALSGGDVRYITKGGGSAFAGATTVQGG
jgi:lipoyl(octanoyl) transferase